LYIASKDKREFVGHSAPEVLGLVTMWEHFGDDWLSKKNDLPDILDEVITDVTDKGH
jgi:hypothetical protein